MLFVLSCSNTGFPAKSDFVRIKVECGMLRQVSRRLAVEDTLRVPVTLEVFGESPRTLGRDCHGVALTSPDPIVALYKAEKPDRLRLSRVTGSRCSS